MNYYTILTFSSFILFLNGEESFPTRGEVAKDSNIDFLLLLFLLAFGEFPLPASSKLGKLNGNVDKAFGSSPMNGILNKLGFNSGRDKL